MLGVDSYWRHRSWRIQILPFLEEQSTYEQFIDADIRLEYRVTPTAGGPRHPTTMPVYQCPSSLGIVRPDVWVTNLRTKEVVFDGATYSDHMVSYTVRFRSVGGGPFDPDFQAGAWRGGSRRIWDGRQEDEHFDQPARLKYITDGLSNTILVAEDAGSPGRYCRNKQVELLTASSGRFIGAVTWFREGSTPNVTNDHDCPDEAGRELIRAINGSNFGHLYGFHSGVNTVFCDGSLQFISEDADDKIVYAMLTRAREGK